MAVVSASIANMLIVASVNTPGVLKVAAPRPIQEMNGVGDTLCAILVLAKVFDEESHNR